MQDLAAKKCVACEGTETPLSREESEKLLQQLNSPDAPGSGPRQQRSSGLNGWTLSGDARWISKEFLFKDFTGAFAFAKKIADIAQVEGHHPDLQISWGKTTVELTTHAIKGLSENDFILAAKIDKLG